MTSAPDPGKASADGGGLARQLRLDLPVTPLGDAGLAGLVRTPANAGAIQRLMAVAQWRDPWLMVVGPRACGLSEMARRFAQEAGVSLLAGGALPELDASEIARLARDGVALDDAEQVRDGAVLLQLLNACREQGRACVLFSHELPAVWPTGPDDLRSRLKGMDSVEVLRPDAAMMEARLQLALRARFILMGPEVARYLIAQLPPTYEVIVEVAARIDRMMAATGRGLTTVLAREVLAAWPEIAPSGRGEEGDTGELFG